MELLKTTREYDLSYWTDNYPIVPNDWKNLGSPYNMTRREQQYNFIANCMRAANIRSCDMKSCTLPEGLMSFSEEMFSHDNVHFATSHGMIIAKDETTTGIAAKTQKNTQYENSESNKLNRLCGVNGDGCHESKPGSGSEFMG